MINNKGECKNSTAKQIIDNYLGQKASEEANGGSLSPVEAILDENNTENVFLYDDVGEKVEFEQIAVIPLRNKIYVILRPLIKLYGMAEDEALVFFIEDADDEMSLITETDYDMINEVFDEYYEMLKLAQVDIS